MKIDKMWKLVALAFWIPGLSLIGLSNVFDSQKCFEFGFMWIFGASPFWGFMIFIDWVSRLDK